jgi:hypothetical protein
VTGTLRLPAESTVAAVTIHPATALGNWLYTGFAEDLVEHGFAVLTYRWRECLELGRAGSREARHGG